MPDDIVPMATLIEGYEQAMGRFLDVRNSRDPVATFLPLFEALNWTVAIDSRFEKAWRCDPLYREGEWWSDGYIHGNTVKGVRFARNRVHHQWADALQMTTGTAFPLTFPMTFMEWRWRIELPAGDSDQFKEHYDQEVASHPARVTLQNVADCLRDASGQRLAG
jgi:hypothetical protein